MGGGARIRRSLALALIGLGVLACAPAEAAPPPIVAENGPVHALVGGGQAVLGNGLAERAWQLAPFRTEILSDLRNGGRVWSRDHRDFSLTIAGAELGSEAFSVDDAEATELPRGGLRLTFTLRAAGLPLLTVKRAVESYPGVAGFQTETTIESAAPLALSGYILEEAAAGPATPSLQAFRAGADWREPEWAGPPISVGDPHPGTWRVGSQAGTGQPLAGEGEWLSLQDRDRSLFLVLERNDFPSSRVGYDGGVARALVDHSRDVIDFGPFEENIHVENPIPLGAARVRTVRPGEPLRLAPVFTGFGDHDGDEPWQFHRYLAEDRLPPYPHAITFNSNGVDGNRISTGAKDDMDLATTTEVAAIARRLGVETFILDDGWQARSGDWQPDSPQYPEPRWDGSPGSKFKPRFPDPTYDAVRSAIAPMSLGLWMSPTFFNPSAATFTQHPDWACEPLAAPLLAQNLAQPGDGSNEAGLGPWSQSALGHVEARIRDAIDNWGVVYFKFDFLAWFDCLQSGGGVRDMYEMHDAFLAMLDRLQHDHPAVTFQIDETNDYRLFPFESVLRGPSWFQNGHPPQSQILHNLWNLSPYIPGFSLGQNALASEEFNRYPVDALMAASLLSHITFFSDIRRLPDTVIDQVKVWTDFYKRSRPLLDGVVYPLLGDPLEEGWTALQSWDPEAGDGALLAFRQGAGEQTKTIALRNVPDGRYELTSAPDDTPFGSFDAAELRSGIAVDVPEAEGAEVLLIRRPSAGEPEPPQPPGGIQSPGGGVSPASSPQTTVTISVKKCKRRQRRGGHRVRHRCTPKKKPGL